MKKVIDEWGEWQTNGKVSLLVNPSEKWIDHNFIVKLETDKTSILADGTDTATITATINKATGETIRFYDSFDNLLDEVVEVEKKASLKVTSTQTGVIEIKVVSENYGSSSIEIEVV